MIEARSPYATQGYVLLKLEPHLHTLHSDGQHDVRAMLEACRSAGYDAVAVTDHNTISGVGDALQIADELGLILVPGVEVTTFHGHCVALGVSTVPEWRELAIPGLAASVRAEGGLLSLAHPAALGSPLCSGCAWEWPIDPSLIDLFEVFSAPRPNVEVPLALWRHLLQAGGRVAPAAAGDVHSRSAAAQQRPATYVYARERTRAGVLDALRQRRVLASADGPPEFWIETADGALALIGDRVATEEWTGRVSDGATLETVEIDAGRLAVFALRRGHQQQLEAVSAPIWIETSH